MHYYDYIKSPYWEDVKNRYKKSKLPQNCTRCGLNNKIVYHHLTYKRLGHERLWDIIPVCWDCHGKIHEEFQLAYEVWCSKWKNIDCSKKSMRFKKQNEKPSIRKWRKNKYIINN